MTQMMEKLDKLFEELVPASGPADTMAGELVRATVRIAYRYYNDGDMIGKGYGKETCNPAARFLMEKFPDLYVDTIVNMWQTWNEDTYEAELEALATITVMNIKINKELREMPGEDFWNYRTSEDVDDEEEEEEDYWEEDDEEEWEE